MKLTPRLHQEEAIQLALAQIGASEGCLIGDEPGAGKTLIGAEFVLRAMRDHAWTRVLFIALPDTHKQWAERISEQSDGAVQARPMNGTKAGRENFEAFMKHEPGIFIAGSAYLMEKDWESELQWKVVGDERVPVWKMDKKTGAAATDGNGERIQERKTVRQNTYARFQRKPLDGIVFDEVQAIANRKSKTRQTILSIKAAYRMAMSGTWFMNSVANQWSIARWVWPGEDPATGEPYVDTSFDRWKKRFLMEEEVRGRGGRVLEGPRGAAITRVTGERSPGEFVSTLPAYRRIENDDRPPEPIRIFVDPTPQQRAQIEDFQRDLMTWVMGWEGEQIPLVADMPPVLRVRIRQAAIAELSLAVNPLTGEEMVTFADDAPSAKLTPLRYLLEEHWPGQPVGIFTDSKIGAYFIAQRMRRAGLSVGVWTGDLSRSEREELKRAFIAREFQYLIGTIQSMGTGIDMLQTVCNKVVWVSKADGNPALNEQALARYFRSGRTLDHGGFEHVELVMRDSVDEESLELLLAKAWAMRSAMNGGEAAA